MGKARTHKENILRRLKKSGVDATAPTPPAYIFTGLPIPYLKPAQLLVLLTPASPSPLLSSPRESLSCDG